MIKFSSESAPNHKNPRQTPQPRSNAEVAVSRSPAGSEEVDDADCARAGSPEPLHDSVAGTHAALERVAQMTTAERSTSMLQGKGHPSLHPIPKAKTWSFKQKK